MVIDDEWDFDPNHQGEELNFDIASWPLELGDRRYTLRLEEANQYDFDARGRSRKRNLARMKAATLRQDIAHIQVHYSCCIDRFQQDAIQSLVKSDDRQWISFTMFGINGIGDLYAKPASAEHLYAFFLSLTKFKVLILQSSTSSRGHGLEIILKAIPYFDNLEVLRLEGWQMDRVSVAALVESLQFQHGKSVTCLSIRSCLFIGEGTFHQISRGLCSISQLETLNLSYCKLGDDEIIPLVDSMKRHPSIKRVHLGGNFCTSQDSVSSLAEWIVDPTCNICDLNIRALWIGFSEEGLVQRFVNLNPFLNSLSVNKSLRYLTMSENLLEDEDVQQLTNALLASPISKLNFLDVGDNPFDEAGAMSLLEVVRGVRSLRAIRFENHLLQYRCTELVKLLAEFNLYDSLLVDKDVPMPVWPHAFSCVQEQRTKISKPSDKRATNVLYRLLRSPTGPFGQQLLLRIAMDRTSVECLEQ